MHLNKGTRMIGRLKSRDRFKAVLIGQSTSKSNNSQLRCHLKPSTFMFIALAIVILQSPQTEGSNQRCPAEVVENIQSCVTPVIREAERLGVGIKDATGGGQELIPHMGTKVFIQLCKLIEQFEYCLTEHQARELCPNHITLSLMDASYGFLCSDGKQLFLDNADCLMGLDSEPGIKQCHDSTMSRIKEANAQNSANLEQKTMEMCKALDAFTMCVQAPVMSQCGEPAWSVIVHVLRDTTLTLMPNCQLSPKVFIPSYRIDQTIADDPRTEPFQDDTYVLSNSRNSRINGASMTARFRCHSAAGLLSVWVSVLFSCARYALWSL